MAYEIDQIHIDSCNETIKFLYKDGEWSCRVTTWETVDGIKEENSFINACTAEDVIIALLLDMSHIDKDISVSKGPLGTQVPTQSRSYEGDFGRSSYHPDNPLYRLVGDDGLRFR